MKLPRLMMYCLALLGALWLGAAQALPSVDEVQAATQRGDYVAAEKMMREVVAAKPGSARAHYVLAEILAHERQFTEAQEQARKARSLDPSIKFTDPTRFKAFEELLAREQRGQSAPPRLSSADAGLPAALPRPAPAPAPAQASGGGVPVWLLLGGAVVFILAAAAWMRRRAADAATVVYPAPAPAYGGAAGGAYGGGYGAAPAPGYGYAPQAPAPSGPGLMGVGLAAAGGVAAGMLAEKLLHEGSRDDGSERRYRDDSAGSAAAAPGGLIPGSFADAGDDEAARELSSRSIDFGTGNGWDDGGGSVDTDTGSSGGSDDW